MFSTGLILILAAYFATRNGECSLQVDHDLQSDDGELEWWQTAVFYQIYPRSFQDSDNDGLGDLQGIISRLDHLKDAGVTATWLSPIFSSPQVDQGYDISDYYSIDKIFGTMADLDELIAKAKELGIKIILDFVPNHTSDQHEWFKLSVNRTNGYEDFYVWRDAVNGSLPNNWISEFKGPAWTWNEERNQYYYHQFAPQQPDLNYSNPTVLKEMKKVITFWLDKGVDGFRMDAVPYLFEDAQFRDAPYARGYSSCDGDNVCLDITNVLKDLDGTYDVIYQFRELVDQYVEDNNLNESKVLMTEAYTTPENTMLYYGSSDGKRKGAHFSFNFNFISYLTGTDFSIDDISNAISKWLVYIPKGATNNWVLGNHDNHRVATRFGEDNVDGFNMLVAFLPGVMVTYNGEEIGMLDGEVTCEEGQDPSAIKNCSTFAENSRDFERTPFQWDNSTYAGFSNATPWLPVGSTKDWLNLAAQTEVTNVRSHFSIYKELLEFRQIFKKSSQVDELSTVKLSEEVLQIVRLRDNDEYIFLFNIGDSEQTVDFLRRANCHQVLVASVNSNQKKGNRVSKNVVLNGHESLILQNGAACSSSSRQLVSSVVPIVVLFSVVRYLISIMDKLFNLV